MSTVQVNRRIRILRELVSGNKSRNSCYVIDVCDEVDFDKFVKGVETRDLVLNQWRPGKVQALAYRKIVYWPSIKSRAVKMCDLDIFNLKRKQASHPIRFRALCT